MQRQSLYFNQPYHVTLKTEELAEPKKNEVAVASLFSAISTGTEMLFYRGEFPEDLELDSQIKSLKQKVLYPFKYGYAVVGRIIKSGSHINKKLLGKTVFSLHPHESHFIATLDELLILPDTLSPMTCLFYPFCETAINFLLDGQPIIGEDVLVIGQGIIGLITAALLRHFPLRTLLSIDKIPLRRAYSRDLGVDYSFAFHPENQPAQNKEVIKTIHDLLQAKGNTRGLDLIYELSGDMDALNLALNLGGFSSRIIVGSWYGKKRKELELGSDFHRQRIQLKSSQVSTLAPEISGRWDKARRSSITWETLASIQPEKFITHTFPFEQAATAYHLLDKHQEQALQVVLKY